MVIAAVLAPWVTPYDPNEQFFDGLTLEGAPLPPSRRFWMGTDLLGRDLYTRLVYGARTSLVIGIVANAVAVLIGTVCSARLPVMWADGWAPPSCGSPT